LTYKNEENKIKLNAMFYQCSKCKRVWQYPIEKCPECFLGLERMRGEKIKVAGISKVNIPTILHPKTPYFVLLLEDENGNKWVQKSIKEYKIGEEFKELSSLNKDGVAIWRVKYDILEGIEKVIELLGGLTARQDWPGAKILILPTLISPKHSYFADNTSPEFLAATIRYLQEKGVSSENIKVVGQSFNEIPIGASAQKSQLLAVCEEVKISPLDLAQTKFVKKDNFEISEEVFSADLVINLPILKVGTASASENLFKLLKKENYLGLKYLSSEKEIIENLLKFLLARRSPKGEGGPPILTLAEAQNVQIRDKFVTFLGLVLAGFNALNLDRVFAEITMADPRRLPEVLKNVKIENIPILGRKVDEVQFNLPR